MIQEFKEFVSKGNVIMLAVGFIMGVAFQGLVNSLVENVIMRSWPYRSGSRTSTS